MHIARQALAFFSGVVLGVAPGFAAAQGGVAVGGSAVWARPGYGPVAPYVSGVYAPWPLYAPWGPCGARFCGDSIALRRYIAREIRRQELAAGADAAGAGGFARPGESPFGPPRYLPPPTPESEIQPRFQGSGEILPQFRETGQATARPGG